MTYIGLVGEGGEVHPAFQKLSDRAQSVISLGAPATTDALEFLDGKLMLGKIAARKQVTVETLRQRVGKEQLQRLFTDSRLRCHGQLDHVVVDDRYLGLSD